MDAQCSHLKPNQPHQGVSMASKNKAPGFDHCTATLHEMMLHLLHRYTEKRDSDQNLEWAEFAVALPKACNELVIHSRNQNTHIPREMKEWLKVVAKCLPTSKCSAVGKKGQKRIWTNFPEQCVPFDQLCEVANPICTSTGALIVSAVCCNNWHWLQRLSVGIFSGPLSSAHPSHFLSYLLTFQF